MERRAYKKCYLKFWDITGFSPTPYCTTITRIGTNIYDFEYESGGKTVHLYIRYHPDFDLASYLPNFCPPPPPPPPLPPTPQEQCARVEPEWDIGLTLYD